LQAEGEAAGLMVMLSFAAAVCVGCDESLTEKEMVEVPTEVSAGVPEMEPLELPMERPEGKPAALNVYGAAPPVAEMDAEYAPPAVPLERLVLVMFSGAGSAGGLPEFDVGVRVALPQPATKSEMATSKDCGFCMTATPAIHASRSVGQRK